MFCPNFEICEGELHFTFNAVSQGEGPWETFLGYEPELQEQTCKCEFTDDRWDDLYKQAVDGFEAGYPYDAP